MRVAGRRRAGPPFIGFGGPALASSLVPLYSGRGAGGEGKVEGSQTFTAKVHVTGAYRDFQTLRIGTARIPAAGRYTISIKPKTIAAGSGLMDLRTVTLTARKPASDRRVGLSPPSHVGGLKPTLPLKGPEADRPLLWYRQPAPRWIEALPLGNGQLGAMVFGAVGRERIQLNDDTLWAGRAMDRHNPEALKALPEVRRLLFAEKHEEAARLAQRTMLGVPCQIESYQPLGDSLAGRRSPLVFRERGDW